MPSCRLRDDDRLVLSPKPDTKREHHCQTVAQGCNETKGIRQVISHPSSDQVAVVNIWNLPMTGR